MHNEAAPAVDEQDGSQCPRGSLNPADTAGHSPGQRYAPKVAGELGLGDFGGLAVVASDDDERLARSKRMVLNSDGDVAFVDELSRHTAVLEVLALLTLGSARECEWRILYPAPLSVQLPIPEQPHCGMPRA